MAETENQTTPTISIISIFFPQESLSSLLVSMKEGLSQVKVILQCCPRQQERTTLYPSPLPRHQLSHAAMMTKGDEQWTFCHGKIQVSLILKTLKPNSGSFASIGLNSCQVLLMFIIQ